MDCYVYYIYYMKSTIYVFILYIFVSGPEKARNRNTDYYL